MFADLFGNEQFYAIDVGARFRLHPLFGDFLSLLMIDALEPDDVECKRLQQGSPPNLRFLPIALAKKTGTYPFYLLKTSSGSSIYPPKADVPLPFRPPASYSGIDKVLEMNCLSFPDFRQRYDRPPPTYLKLDTQGSELDILEGFSPRDWDELVCIETEVEFIELYNGQPLFHDVHSFLIEKGFVLLHLYRHPTYYGKEGNKYWYLETDLKLFKNQFDKVNSPFVSGDAVYFRFPFSVDCFSSRKKLLAFILGAIMWQHLDLALWLLDQSKRSVVLDENETSKLRDLIWLLSPKDNKSLYLAKKAFNFQPIRFFRVRSDRIKSALKSLKMFR